MVSLQADEQEALGQDSQGSLEPRELCSEMPRGTTWENEGRSGQKVAGGTPDCSQRKQSKKLSKSNDGTFPNIMDQGDRGLERMAVGSSDKSPQLFLHVAQHH